MPRCSFVMRPTRRLAFSMARLLLAFSFTTVAGLLVTVPVSVQAQMVPLIGDGRNFPDAALRGHLVITGQGMAEINGQAIRMAPGMRLFNTENALVMLHTVIGQKFTVNYLIEPNTGLLLTAWMLTSTEAAQQRRGGGVQRNYLFESERRSAP